MTKRRIAAAGLAIAFALSAGGVLAEGAGTAPILKPADATTGGVTPAAAGGATSPISTGTKSYSGGCGARTASLGS